MQHYQSITNRKIRIAIVGCGRISKNHFGSIEKHGDELELVAICDINPAVLKEHAERYKVPAYRDMEEMLQKEQLDLVALCTPSGIHPDQADPGLVNPRSPEESHRKTSGSLGALELTCAGTKHEGAGVRRPLKPPSR